MTIEQLQVLRKKLVKEKQQIEYRMKHNENFGLDDSMKDSVGDLSSYDNHSADMGTEMYEREKDFALNDLDEEHLRKVHGALDRIDQGTYGYCKVCQREIAFQRLEAVPFTEYCIEHAE